MNHHPGSWECLIPADFFLLGPMAILFNGHLSLKLVGVVRARNYAKSSSSKSVLSMIGLESSVFDLESKGLANFELSNYIPRVGTAMLDKGDSSRSNILAWT